MRIGFVVINVTLVFLLMSFVALVSAKKYGDVKELQIGVKYKPKTCKVKAQKGDSVSVEYIGKLTDGTVFDSSINKGYPLEFRVGFGHVIDGWDQGVIGMCLGEKRKLKIPPKLGYGEKGTAGIPGGATLIFETELVGLNGKTLDDVKSDDKEL